MVYYRRMTQVLNVCSFQSTIFSCTFIMTDQILTANWTLITMLMLTVPEEDVTVACSFTQILQIHPVQRWDQWEIWRLWSTIFIILTFLREDRSIILNEEYTLFSISSLYTVKNVFAVVEGACKHRMHYHLRTEATCLLLSPPAAESSNGKKISLSDDPLLHRIVRWLDRSFCANLRDPNIVIETDHALDTRLVYSRAHDQRCHVRPHRTLSHLQCLRGYLTKQPQGGVGIV